MPITMTARRLVSAEQCGRLGAAGAAMFRSALKGLRSRPRVWGCDILPTAVENKVGQVKPQISWTWENVAFLLTGLG